MSISRGSAVCRPEKHPTISLILLTLDPFEISIIPCDFVLLRLSRKGCVNYAKLRIPPSSAWLPVTYYSGTVRAPTPSFKALTNSLALRKTSFPLCRPTFDTSCRCRRRISIALITRPKSAKMLTHPFVRRDGVSSSLGSLSACGLEASIFVLSLLIN